MVSGTERRRAAHGRWRIAVWALLALLALCLICVGVVRFYPYEMAYPSLPRLTYTDAGAKGDPINLILIGKASQISGAFERAGWLVPDPITAQTAARIAAASLAHQSYPHAPVSNLFVFGRPQDLTFEKPTSDVQYRDHIRLWQTDQSLGGSPIWIAQASYDAGIELSASTGFPTHHIAPAIDKERARVGASLQQSGVVTQAALVAYTTPILAARNGGGDFYETDGAALVINLTPSPFSVTAQPGAISALNSGVFWVYDAVVTAGAPAVVLVTLVMALALLALGATVSVGGKRRRSAA